MMEINEILAHVDHTLLSQTATWDEIRQICDDGMKISHRVCMHSLHLT